MDTYNPEPRLEGKPSNTHKSLKYKFIKNGDMRQPRQGPIWAILYFGNLNLTLFSRQEKKSL